MVQLWVGSDFPDDPDSRSGTIGGFEYGLADLINTNTANISTFTESAFPEATGRSVELVSGQVFITGQVLRILYDTNATNISTNTSNISTNTSNISTNTSNIASIEAGAFPQTTGRYIEIISGQVFSTGDYNRSVGTTNAANISTNTVDIATLKSSTGINFANIFTTGENLATATGLNRDYIHATGAANLARIADNTEYFQAQFSSLDIAGLDARHKPSDRVLTSSIILNDGEVYDGTGVTYNLSTNWNFIPIRIQGDDVTLKNININAHGWKASDVLANYGIITVVGDGNEDRIKRVRLENVRVSGVGEIPGTQQKSSQTPLYVLAAEDLTVENCEFCYSASGHNIHLQNTRRVKLINNDVHHAYLDGIKYDSPAYGAVFEKNYSYRNGSMGRIRPGGHPTINSGGGINLTQGGPIDLIGNSCEYNDNGIAFKYNQEFSWLNALNDWRSGVYAVNIMGGELRYNGNGFQMQGLCDTTDSSYAGVSGNAPFPMGFNAIGVLAEANSGAGFQVQHGSVNFDKCIAYKNYRYGFDLQRWSHHCHVQDCMMVSNGDHTLDYLYGGSGGTSHDISVVPVPIYTANLRMGGSGNDVSHTRIYGVDVFSGNAIEWKQDPVFRIIGSATQASGENPQTSFKWPRLGTPHYLSDAIAVDSVPIYSGQSTYGITYTYPDDFGGPDDSAAHLLRGGIFSRIYNKFSALGNADQAIGIDNTTVNPIPAANWRDEWD